MKKKEIEKEIKLNMDFAEKEQEQNQNSFSILDKKIDEVNNKILDFVAKKSNNELLNLKEKEKELKNLQLKQIKEKLEKKQFVSSVSDKINNLDNNLNKLNISNDTKKKIEKKEVLKEKQIKENEFILEKYNQLKKYWKGSKEGLLEKLKQKYSVKKYFSASKDINIKFKDFSASVLANQIKMPYKFKTIAFSEGTWHNTFYSWDVIKEAKEKIINTPIVTYHTPKDDNVSVLTEVGKITNFELDEQNKSLIAEGELFDTTAGNDIAVLLANKRITDVSARIDDDCDFDKSNKINDWLHIAFVKKGEVSNAKICQNDECSF